MADLTDTALGINFCVDEVFFAKDRQQRYYDSSNTPVQKLMFILTDGGSN
jgi:hypothetical protein